MTDTAFEVIVHGHAAPKGSITQGTSPQGRRFVKESSPRTKPWVEDVAVATSFAWRLRLPLDRPVAVRIVFRLPKPPSNRHPFPTSRGVGDVDKLVRGVLDGMQQGGVLADDVDVVRVEAVKVWADDVRSPGAYIRAWTMSDLEQEVAGAGP